MTLAVAAEAGLSWNLARDVRQMFAYPFMVNAFRAGTIVAATAGVIGWFMILRRQAFAGHTLAVAGFPGAAGAVWLGVGATYGYFAFCLAAALAIAAIPGVGGAAAGRAEESAAVGTIQAFALACGFLFVSLYKGFLGGVNTLLFGSFLGITGGMVLTLAAVALTVLVVLALIGRPLLFASVDPAVAAAAGVPVRGLSVAFLILLGIAAAEVSQITGTLLVFTLLVIPAAAAQVLTARPALGLTLTVLLGVGVTWTGLTVAYYSPYPIGFFITSFSFGIYLLARLAVGVHDRLGRAARGLRTAGVAA
ncbi:metal ABC transporter permease [Protofrankia symbiont of Coriaria ruscifolia]|uniref:ABC transporter n=1 Tax=Candidatus Protofrankia californiensis TaxID=1839754 RepID=A0A1C3NYF1_9ACTN|nr:metal ABC transporter permease [Protofrankia symbiont of Coriaria ruscifolia]SBW22560.1 ABC transporter [Candidatus Protofrankia californiensis]